MIRGGGCAIRPAPTQEWAAATYLAIGTTKKELRRDTTTKNRSHEPQIYTTISPGCVRAQINEELFDFFFIEFNLICIWLVKKWITKQAFSELLRKIKVNKEVKKYFLGRI